jgi:hypothetical protein
MKDANFETETLYHVIECRDLEEKEAATTGDKKTMLQVIGGWYKDGFRFLESFELAKMHYGVFTKDVEVAMSTAPTTEPAKRPPLSEWPSYVLEINRLRLIEQQYTIGRVWNIAGYVMDWHGCDGELRITESINELFELVSAVQDVLTNAGIAIAITGQGLNHHVTRRAFVEQIAEIICEQAKGIGQDAATTVQEASDPMTKEFFLDYEELKSLREANKRQGAIIDDLLRDKAELKAKADSLAESVMSITDMNSEIAEKCEGMMTVLDAKTLAYLAYNRGRSIGELHCTLDFENWWVEFRKESGFGSEQAEAVHVFPPSDFPAFTAGYFFNQLKEPLRTHVMSQANNMLSEAESLHYALDSRQFLDWDKTREGRAFWEDVTAYLKSGNVPIESAGSRLARQCMPDNYVFPAAKP